MSNIREPKKKSSIEKKRRIIEKGFYLMCERGYHNVTCCDIAASAGVSTGIIYQYFKDKRDIYIEGVKIYSNKIMFPVFDIINKKVTRDNFSTFLDDILDDFVKIHSASKSAHSSITAMSLLDPEIAMIFYDEEMTASCAIGDYLSDIGIELYNRREVVHFIMGIIDNYCHEVVYHRHDDLDYGVYKDCVKKMIIYILKTNIE